MKSLIWLNFSTEVSILPRSTFDMDYEYCPKVRAT